MIMRVMRAYGQSHSQKEAERNLPSKNSGARQRKKFNSSLTGVILGTCMSNGSRH